MAVFWSLLGLTVLLFFITLIGRLVLDWIQLFARDWRPHGPVLVVAEAIYTITDPPLKALRRLIPPVRLGQIQIDLAFTVLFIATIVAMRLIPS
ncbi:MAG: YggT family protein [Angustibacter sp.]